MSMTNEEREVVMRAWDSWRKYIAEGGGGSWPRDEFEGLLDNLDVRAEAAEAALDAYQHGPPAESQQLNGALTALEAANARIEALEYNLAAAEHDLATETQMRKDQDRRLEKAEARAEAAEKLRDEALQERDAVWEDKEYQQARAEAAEKERDEFRRLLDKGPAASVEAQAEINHWKGRAEKAEELADKYKWQVIDTCKRAETAEKRVKEMESEFYSMTVAMRTVNVLRAAEACGEDCHLRKALEGKP